MARFVSVLGLFALLLLAAGGMPARAQSTESEPISAPAGSAAPLRVEAAQAPNTPQSALVVSKGTKVVLLLMEDLRSGSARKGQPVAFTVATEVRSADGHDLLLPAGTPAVGKVTESHGARGFGRPGRISVTCDVLLVQGSPGSIPRSVPVSAAGGSGIESKGRDSRGLAWVAALAAGYVAGTYLGEHTSLANEATPIGAALVGISAIILTGALWHGGNATLKQGTRFTVFVTADTPLGPVAPAAPPAAGDDQPNAPP
jgi:hypothetical protein